MRESILVTDCGSTTTKAIWFKKDQGIWKIWARAEAATTVEKPVADVTIGVLNAASSIEKMMGASLLAKDSISRGPSSDINAFLSTSSAGGGLQMVVLGLMRGTSANLAEKAALGGGAIVLRSVALDEVDDLLEVIRDIRNDRPDIILLSGGIDGGAKDQVFELANILLSSESKARFGGDKKVPLVYAGNKALVKEIENILGGVYSVIISENIQPRLDAENLHPVREVIHEVFLSHVMSQAPGYNKLMSWVDDEILPTPVAVSNMIEVAARTLDLSIISADIGGATTDIFSIRRDGNSFSEVNRTVSANLGMSYSIGNVLTSSGVEKIIRWLPFEAEEEWVLDIIWNKMYRPTTLPDSLRELLVEQAVAREALSLALKQHFSLIKDSKKDKGAQDFSKFFSKSEEVTSMFDIDFILGSGGVLSHAPDRKSALLMILDSFIPKGSTFIGVDSIFMLPHLGTLSKVDQDGSIDILMKDCIVPLANVLSPEFLSAKVKIGDEIGRIRFSNGKEETLKAGDFKVISIEDGEQVTLLDCKSNVTFGGLSSFSMRKSLVGLVIDCRNLNQYFSSERKEQIRFLREWYRALDLEVE